MRREPLIEAAAVAALVTAVVTGGVMVVPKQHAGTFVGMAFLAAVYWRVWRRGDDDVKRAGLGLGGLMLSDRISPRKLTRDVASSLAWALGFALALFPPFYVAWSWWWRPGEHFSLILEPRDTTNLVLGQVVLVALPEEAFYRGFLQTRLDEALGTRWRVFGASVGPGLLVASVVFALGHVLTVHAAARLAVFFPSLLFGWLRARTGGVGASVAFHVLCNLFTEVLGRGYGLY